jgi:hypothetical protein
VPLTKAERNAIFELVQESDLDPADFAPPSNQDDGDTWLEHKPSASLYIIGEEDLASGLRPIARQVGAGPSEARHVGDLLGEVAGWLRGIEHDLNTPDLWAEFARERETLNSPVPAPADNTPFTADEQAEIEQRLSDVAKYAVESGKFEDDELRVLNAKIDYLIESSKHARRFDWREQIVGALVGAVVGNVLPQGATLDVLNMIVGTVGHLIGHPVPGLPR